MSRYDLSTGGYTFDEPPSISRLGFGRGGSDHDVRLVHVKTNFIAGDWALYGVAPVCFAFENSAGYLYGFGAFGLGVRNGDNGK